MLDSLGIRHLALKVKNFEECLIFYTQVLGMKVDWKPDDENVYLTNGIDNLALHYDQNISDMKNDSRLDHFGIFIKNKDDIDVQQYHSGRTIPSQDINPVDRSDRPGEDVEMVTKTNLDVDFQDVDSELMDIIKNEEIHQKKKKKEEWETMISDLDDLLD